MTEVTIDIEKFKQQAAAQAVELVESGMIVGLGSGSTATYAIDMLAKRVADGLNITAIATSEQSQQQAEKGGIHMTSFSQHEEIDLTIDGADQVEKGSLNLIKGLGGALLREKMVALASKQLVIIIDERKLVDHLGKKSPLPVEIIPFAWEITKSHTSKLFPKVTLRLNADKKPFVTDGGHYILDCQFDKIENVANLARGLKLLPGVVETGLFVNLANLVIVAGQNGITRLQQKA